jgi:serine/threonine-protein kinase
VALGGGDDSSPPTNAAKSEQPKKAKSTGKEEAAAPEQETETPVDTADAPAAPAGTDPSALNDQGFALIEDGRPDEAVPILQQAVDSYPEGTTDLGYAYALYNLGNALYLAGRPDEAIPILEERLKIPDQTETVQETLDAARAAAGQ